MYKKYIKRLIDIFFSVIMIIGLFPFLLIIAILIMIDMGSPVFFTQERVGKDLTLFKIFKFRSMKDKGEGDNSDAARVTKLGRILRKFSLDEFPQLINILKGEMSFIGPRPLLKRYIPYYNKREIRRQEVLPGMASLADIKGRSHLTWEEQFEYDVKYVDNLTLRQDTYIFLQTVFIVLGAKDNMAVGRFNTDSFDVHRKKQNILKKNNRKDEQ